MRALGLTLLVLLPGCMTFSGRRDHLWLSVGQQGPTEDVGLPNTGLQVDSATSLAVTYLNVPDAGGAGWEVGLRHARGKTNEAGSSAELETWTFEGGGLWEWWW